MKLRPISRFALALAFCVGTLPLFAQAPPEDPKQLVRDVSYNELKAGGNLKFMWREVKKTPSGTETRLIVQTKDSTVGLLIAINGKPLDPQRQQFEDARLQELIRNSESLQKKKAKEKSDDDNSDRIIRGLPDAFIYEYDGFAQGSESTGKPGHQLIRLKFKPDPQYSPPSHTEQVLTGMQGTMLIDQQEKRMALIDGTLFQQVGFGWGILGHLEKGGHFLIQQADVGDGHWEITHMVLDLTGKILLVKSLRIDEETTATNFQRAPADLTFSQGVALLKKQQQDLSADAGSPSQQLASRH